jgi:2-iminobutanoate/2-iminopropanoate deaminase
MKRDVISEPGVPVSHLPFSPGLRVNGFVFVSGQASVDATGKIVNDTFEGEFRRSMENVKKVLAGAGLTLADVVQVRSYVNAQSDLAEYNKLYREYFTAPFPARTTLIGCLGTLLKFEIDVTAIDNSQSKKPAKKKPAAKAIKATPTKSTKTKKTK